MPPNESTSDANIWLRTKSVDEEISDAVAWYGANGRNHDAASQSHYSKAVLDRYHGWQRLEAEIALIKRGYDPNMVPFDKLDLALPLRPGTGYDVIQRVDTLLEKCGHPVRS